MVLKGRGNRKDVVLDRRKGVAGRHGYWLVGGKRLGEVRNCDYIRVNFGRIFLKKAECKVEIVFRGISTFKTQSIRQRSIIQKIHLG